MMERLHYLACGLGTPQNIAILFGAMLLCVFLWRGGSIAEIKVPGLVEGKLRRPLNFRGSMGWLWGAILSGTLAGILFLITMLKLCPACEPGFPGNTAWIFLGSIEGNSGEWKQGPYRESAESAKQPNEIEAGDIVTTTAKIRTVIPGFNQTGTERAMESPFVKEAFAPSYTCRRIEVNTRMKVARRDEGTGSNGVTYIWLRVEDAPNE